MRTLARTRRFTSVLLVTILLTLAAAQPALAAGGDFDWTFTGKCCIHSREWTTTLTKDIWIDIDSVLPCDTIGGSKPTVRITLQKKGFLGTWSSQGSQDFINCTGDKKWANMGPGVYRFYLTILFPHRDTKDYTIKGSVAYDGRVT
jgi:hypothetical protein